MAQTSKNLIIYGIHPIEEFLGNDFLKAIKMVVRKGSIKNLKHVISLAGQKSVPVKILPDQAFDHQDKTRNSQGVFLITAPFEYSDINVIDVKADTMLLALDLVQDPQNLGSLLRSAAFFGVSGIILQKDRSVQVTPSAIRTSAGGIAYVPVFMVTNLARTLRDLKDRSFWIIGADSNEGVSSDSFDPPRPTVLVLGSEGRGLRPNIRKNCDILVRISRQTAFDSLNVAVAGAILMYALGAGAKQK